jgi:glycosyltransferase involved in cell wall biosynthesis
MLIVPVYNESKVIRSVLENTLKIFPNIVAVNDGSRDSTPDEIMKTSAHLVNHPVNLGQGAAIQTGLEYALQDNSINYFVTFDADGQHSVDDVESMMQRIKKEEVDMVLGSRFLGATKNISSAKKAMLKLAILFSNATSKVKLTDAHNGLRVFNRHVASTIDITMPDFAHASEIVEKIAPMNYSYVEHPVTITYTDYSKAKGQSMANAINITFDILLSRITKR